MISPEVARTVLIVCNMLLGINTIWVIVHYVRQIFLRRADPLRPWNSTCEWEKEGAVSTRMAIMSDFVLICIFISGFFWFVVPVGETARLVISAVTVPLAIAVGGSFVFQVIRYELRKTRAKRSE